MTGKELIDYIIANGMQEEEIFISCKGEFGNMNNLSKMGNNPVLSCGDFDVDTKVMKGYFSKWFDIISLEEIWKYQGRNRGILILSPDGTDRYIEENYSLEDLVTEYMNGALFGLEKE